MGGSTGPDFSIGASAPWNKRGVLGYTVGQAQSLIAGPPKAKRAPNAPETPEKDVSMAQRRARQRIRERAAAVGSTRLTGPSGLTEPATTSPKTLLGM